MTPEQRTIAVTGSDGFIGRNLLTRLRERGIAVGAINRATSPSDLREIVLRSDAVVHLAGVNRSDDPEEFTRSNRDYTRMIADAVRASSTKPLVLLTSSTRAGEPSDYGRTKAEAEGIMLELAAAGAATVGILRLPNVFGKWARPNYNSAVATFCHNLARGLPIEIVDPEAPLSLLYIDDLVEQFLDLLASPATSGLVEPTNVYRITVGQVASFLQSVAQGRRAGCIEEVGGGLERALYATFVSYLPVEEFGYAIAQHADDRGSFSEVLKTRSSGQVSVLTAHPGARRGGHYHHTKVEKFLVVRGRACFRFRNIANGDTCEIDTCDAVPTVVETIPGWAHDITNSGSELLVALIWASELFDPRRPDTIAMPL